MEQKEKMAQAKTWIASLSSRQFMQETAKAKRLCEQKKLISPMLKYSIMHKAGLTPEQKLHRLAVAQLTEAYLYRQ